MKQSTIAGLAMFILLASVSAVVRADDSRPLYVEITEVEEEVYTLQVKVPPTIAPTNEPTVALPGDCVEALNPTLRETARARAAGGSRQQCYRCEGGLSGKEITIQYPDYIPSVSTLLKLILLTGERHTVVLGPQETAWLVPEAETTSGVAKDYAQLGVYHIWAGRDHLLFLVCLLWIAGSFRRTLMTITGFTLAHSVTLALSALDVVRVPVPPVEAVIALSVVFLATEIARDQRESLTWRYPIVVSSSFGLLHGLGFAAVLNEIGLPQTELVTGLLFFNVGVEVGQVLFAVVVVAGIYVLKRFTDLWTIKTDLSKRLQTAMSYGVGCTASYCLVERTFAFLNSAL